MKTAEVEAESNLVEVKEPSNRAPDWDLSMIVAAHPPWQRMLSELRQRLLAFGLDVTAPLSVEWYNAAVSPALHLPWLGRDRAPLAILVGNSRAIWEPFKSAIRMQPAGILQLLAEKHPLDAYVSQSVTRALSSFHLVDALSSTGSTPGRNELGVKAAVYWDYDTRPGRLVAMQRLACISGVAYLNEEAHLCVHKQFGPWFALRAVVLFEVDPPTERPETSLLTSKKDLRALPSGLRNVRCHLKNVAFTTKRLNILPIVTKLTLGVDPGGLLLLRLLLEMWDPSSSEHRERLRMEVKAALDQSNISNSKEEPWKKWLAVREAIHPNHPMRYSHDQIEYHYTHNKDILMRLC